MLSFIFYIFFTCILNNCSFTFSCQWLFWKSVVYSFFNYTWAVFYKTTYDKAINIFSRMEWSLMNKIYIKPLIYNIFDFYNFQPLKWPLISLWLLSIHLFGRIKLYGKLFCKMQPWHPKLPTFDTRCNPLQYLKVATKLLEYTFTFIRNYKEIWFMTK